METMRSQVVNIRIFIENIVLNKLNRITRFRVSVIYFIRKSIGKIIYIYESYDNNENENASISMDGTLLKDVNTFKYIGATLKSDGASDNELCIRLATATSVIVRLDKYKTSKISLFMSNTTYTSH